VPGERACANTERKEKKERIMSKNKENRTVRTSADQKLIDGLKKHQGSLTSLFIEGASMSVADVMTTLQGRITSADSVLSARATWLGAVAADKQAREASQPFVSKVRQAVRVAFSGAETLADFGLAPRKPRVVTPTTQVQASAKAKATRKARNTMGARQKEKVKGDVTGISVTPVVTHPVDAPSPGGGTPAPGATVPPTGSSNGASAPPVTPATPHTP